VFSRDGKKELPTWGSCSSKPEVTPKIMYAFSLRSAKKPMIVVVVIAVVVVYANYITEIFLTLFNLLSLRLNLNCVTASMISKQQGGETAIKSDKGGEAEKPTTVGCVLLLLISFFSFCYKGDDGILVLILP